MGEDSRNDFGAGDSAPAPSGDAVAQPPTLMPTVLAVPESQVRPWVRFWARTLDAFLFAVCGGILLGLVSEFGDHSVGDRALQASEWIVDLIFLFLWCFVEPAFLAKWGSTPGKALLRVRVEDANGNLLSYRAALSRSLDVWFRGMGGGLPLIGFIANLAAYSTLTKKGITSWDSERRLRVTHRSVGVVRWVLLMLIFVNILCFAFS